MKILTIAGIIGFFVAISIFLFQGYIEGIIEDSMMNATGEVIKDSNLDEISKQSINIALVLFVFAGTITSIGGLIAKFKNFF